MPKDPAPITVQAPAKINLTLAVLGRRSDGFHEIESWVVKLAWYDRLTIAPARELSLRLDSEANGLAADDTNLVLRAARALALAEEANRPPEAAIALEKHIPIGAGLGGGSSDAAAALRSLNELWGLHWGIERLQAVAARIGSDVPLFVDPAPAVVIRGRGERVEPLSTSPRCWVAVVVPAYSISTADVYRAVDAREVPRRTGAQPWAEPSRSAAQLQSGLFNDLQEAAMAIEPRLAGLIARLDGLDGRRVHMTGSGSCLFALFADRSEARMWAHAAQTAAGQSIRIEVVEML
ncbi:MAG TPA: 4-(cytidine 5'-diphospho)-2-C-methyl-D-erythritol kinase [Phycisphaerae bacterium]|nr:4-(cytidine 5'-diphospho)-2-C-methyl-D-erythritol kinase [Phycisphaerae bacterium]